MNSKGQEEAGYRLLIEAILVILILAIILGVVSQIDQQRILISEKNLMEGFNKALNSPDGSIIVEQGLVLKSGASYSNRAFSGSTAGIKPECIELQASSSMAFKATGGYIVELTTLLQTDVYYKCFPGYLSGSDCEISCIISFGKELEKG